MSEFHDRAATATGTSPPPPACNCCGRGKVPTSKVGSGIGGPGNSVTLDPNSTNMCGAIVIQTGDHPDPLANSLICSIIFDPTTPFAAPPFPVICGTNEETEEAIARIFVKQSNTDALHFEIWSGDIPLEERETYSLNYVCLGSCVNVTPPGDPK